MGAAPADDAALSIREDFAGGEGGGLFTFVTSAGTDPEIILLLEARKTADGPQRMFTAARFSDLNLYLRYKDQEVRTAIRGGENTFFRDAKHLFHFHLDREVPEVVQPR